MKSKNMFYNNRGHVTNNAWHIMKCWRDKENVSIKEIARRMNLTPRGVRYALAKPSSERRKFTPPPAVRRRIKARRRKLRTIVKIKNAAGTGKKFPSCRRMARELHTLGTSCSHRTTLTDLKAMGFISKKRKRTPMLRPEDLPRRVKFCKDYLSSERRPILFSDEKLFDTNDHGARTEWCEADEEAGTRGKSRWAPSVHVWAVIGVGFRKIVILPKCKVTAVVYQNTCLRDIVVPAMKLPQHKNSQFMQDGAPSHTAKLNELFLRGHHVSVIENWPARSPDLNPIENFWDDLQSRVSECGPTDVPSLEQFILKCWNEIQQKVVDDNVRTFVGRCEECVAQGGKIIKYVNKGV
jgi:hypothetical protein